MAEPLVSALMVTHDRPALARRALQCFAAQTWTNRELVVVDDGDTDYEPALVPFRGRFPIRYHRIAHDSSRRLGALRNLSLDDARGEFLIQWDDDEWFHPQRIELQMRALGQQGVDAVTLRDTLMHVDSPALVDHPFRTGLRAGTPGTILHKRTSLRYENRSRGEDSIFRDRLAREMRVGIMKPPHSHLFVRCFHGRNTWDLEHFVKRLRRAPLDRLRCLYARLRSREIHTIHPAFRLDERERETATRFLAESRGLGLFAS